MSAYEVGLRRSAARALTRLQRRDRERVTAAIATLATDPRPNGCRKLTGAADAWRIRIGDYRVVYLVDDSARTVTVTRMGHRRDIYER